MNTWESPSAKGWKPKSHQISKRFARRPTAIVATMAISILLISCARVSPFFRPPGGIIHVPNSSDDTPSRASLSQREADFDAMTSQLLGPDSYDGPECPADCGCPDKNKDCPMWYSAKQVIKSAAVDDPYLLEVMTKRLADRTEKVQVQCASVGRPGALDAGGWCLNARKPPQFYVVGKQNISISLNHAPPADRVVAELSLMIESEKIKSINDFGAGVGQYKAALIDKYPGLTYRAYDGAGNIEEFTKGFLKHFDLTFPLNLPKADWVVSLEVGEHVPSKYEGLMIRNLHRHNCKGIVLSWSVLNQGGYHHINNHANSYIISVFQDLGYLHDVEKSMRFRQKADNHGWFRGSMMVFRRKINAC